MYLKMRRDTKRQETRFDFYIDETPYAWIVCPDWVCADRVLGGLESWVNECKRRYKKAEVIEIGGEDV